MNDYSIGEMRILKEALVGRIKSLRKRLEHLEKKGGNVSMCSQIKAKIERLDQLLTKLNQDLFTKRQAERLQAT